MLLSRRSLDIEDTAGASFPVWLVIDSGQVLVVPLEALQAHPVEAAQLSAASLGVLQAQADEAGQVD